MTTTIRILLLSTAFALAACGHIQDATDPAAQTDGDAALPKPAQRGDAITGMPSQPGPGDVPLGGAPPATVLPPDPTQVDLLNPETGVLPGDATTDTGAPAEPGAAEAAAVIRDYYASIDSRSYARAYALWSDTGRASKQTPEQFAAGFANTAHVSVDVGTPGTEDAGAGQRYLQVPVAVTATQADGSVRRYDGTYTLHRTVVDGASADQRAWRIASADLRELKP